MTTPLLISILKLLIVFGMPTLLVAIVLFYKQRRNKLLFNTIRELVAGGHPIPTELMKLAPAAHTPEADIRTGLITLALALALAALFYETGAPLSIALIPGLVGVADLALGWWGLRVRHTEQMTAITTQR